MTVRWVVSGLVILGGLAGFVVVAHGHGSPRLLLPLYLFAATIHLAAVVFSRKTQDSRPVLLFIVGLGLALRLAVCLTPESREGDYYRYLWDGAITGNGLSPYQSSPAEVLRGDVASPTVMRLRQEGLGVLSRVNHPELRTLYPPVAQSLFALSYWIDPFNSNAWRAVLLLLDAAAALMILLLLRAASLPLAWSITYLWNPLLIVETYHYRHLDLALAPFLLLFLWGLWKEKPYLAAAGLATAAAVKIWPVLLVPFLVTRFWSRRFLLLKSTGSFVLLLVLLFIPYWTSVAAPVSSGTVAYAKTWNANELGFKAIAAVGSILSHGTGYLIDGRVVSRTMLILILLGAALWLGLVSGRNGSQRLATGISLFVLLMMLLGPTIYPWYFVPAMALAPFLRRPALLFWALLLILTYLSRSVANPILLLVVIHLPAWLILILEWRDLNRSGVDRHV